jgi:hypothetical protein
MAKEVTIRLTERVWAEMVAYEPPSPPLAAAIRTKLQAATALTEERPALLAFRITTMTLDEAHGLETWLAAVSRRSDAPVGAGVALVAVREGIRLVEYA